MRRSFNQSTGALHTNHSTTLIACRIHSRHSASYSRPFTVISSIFIMSGMNIPASLTTILFQINIHTSCTAEDNDPDSSMLSSPSNEDEHDSDHNLYNDDEEDQDLFPSSEHPSTPKNNHLNATAPGELSPPQSQSTSQPVATGTEHTIGSGGIGDEGIDAYSNVNGIDGAGEMEEQQNGKTYVPGAGWKTRKAQEDYQRAEQILVDRDFNLREFGDLFDDRAVVQKQLLQEPQQQQQQEQTQAGVEETMAQAQTQ
jgi:hypothetical protein